MEDNYVFKELYAKLVGEDRPMSIYEQQQKAGRKLAQIYGIKRGLIGRILMNTKRVGPFTSEELASKLVDNSMADSLEQAVGYVNTIINDNGRKVGNTSIIRFVAGDVPRFYIEEGDGDD